MMELPVNRQTAFKLIVNNQKTHFFLTFNRLTKLWLSVDKRDQLNPKNELL